MRVSPRLIIIPWWPKAWTVVARTPMTPPVMLPAKGRLRFMGIDVTSIIPRLVKIFMQRDCSIEVVRRDALDSRCHVGNRAQAEQGKGRAERYSFPGDCVLGDNALQTRLGLVGASVPRTGRVWRGIRP